MYAHQVVEDLRHLFALDMDNESRNSVHGKNIVQSIELINKSIKFHIKNDEDILKVRGSSIGKEYLFVDMAEYIKLPYPLIYVDYPVDDPAPIITKVDRVAMLCKQMATNNIEVSVFARYVAKKTWLMGPVYYQIMVGQKPNIFPKRDIRGISSEILDKIIKEDIGELSILQNLIILLNCKNITTEDHKPNVALNKSRRKKGKQELFTYKTLKLVLPSNKKNADSSSQPTGEHNRIHFCRGHFKEYTEDHPLFGKYTGIYWWQPHVRGQNKEGVVIKDYEVKTQW